MSDKYKDALLSMVNQYAYPANVNGRFGLMTGGMSALEETFDVLGWDDPHLYPERECQHDGCYDEATCGTPTKDGYKRLCYKHWKEVS